MGSLSKGFILPSPSVVFNNISLVKQRAQDFGVQQRSVKTMYTTTNYLVNNRNHYLE